MQPLRLISTLIVTLLLLSSCGNDKAEIYSLLDARDTAMSSRNLTAYTKLLHSGYNHQGQQQQDVLKRIGDLFDRFEQIEMSSNDRTIYFADDNSAECEQSYRLRVFADGEWREIMQRERLSFARTAEGWRISGGL